MKRYIITDPTYKDMELAFLRVWGLPNKRYTKKGLNATTNKDFEEKKKLDRYNRAVKALNDFLNGLDYEGKTENSFLRLSIDRNIVYRVGRSKSVEVEEALLLRENQFGHYRQVDYKNKRDKDLLKKLEKRNKELEDKEKSIINDLSKSPINMNFNFTGNEKVKL